MNKRNDRVINLKKVIGYLWKHFVPIIVITICGALGLGGLYYIKNKDTQNASLNTNIDLEEMYKSFSEEEKVNVSYAIYSYERLVDIENYISNCILMEVDPYNACRVSNQYSIELEGASGLDSEEKLTQKNNLLMMYSHYVNYGGLANDILEAGNLNFDISQEDIMEVIFMNYDSNLENSSSFIVGSYLGDIAPEFNEEILRCMESYSEEISKKVKHKITLNNTIEAHQRFDWIYNTQRTMYSERNSIVDRLNGALAELSGNTLTYYNEYIRLYESSSNTPSIEVENVPQQQANNTISMKSLLKYCILGCAVGFIGVCGLLVLMFMFSKNIVSEDDYVATMGMKYIRKVKLSDLEEDLAFAVAKINLICSKNNITKLAMLSSDYEKVANSIKDEMAKLLKKQNIDLIFVKDVMKDCDAMKKLFEIENCIVVEEIGVSRYNSVYDMVELCDENNINIIGVLDIAK